MSDAHAQFERILKLSAFDGDSRRALIELHAHFAEDFPDCSLALLLVRGQGPGRCRLAGLIGPDGTEHVPNLDPNGERRELPLFDDVLARSIVDNAAPHVVTVPPAERAVPLAQALFAPATVLAIPIANSGERRHWLAFGSTLAHRFDGVDLHRAVLHVNLAANLIVRPIVLRALTQESARHRQEIESLADIQKLLLPDNPQIRGLEYAVHWQPAATAAGDYYEMSRLTDFAPPEFPRNGADLWGVIVADVSGHGAAAAMEAVQFDAIMRTYRGDDGAPPPAGAISYANRYFFSRRSRGHFMTVFAVLYRPDTRILSYLSAGHPALLHRRGRHVELLGESDQIPLGVLRDHEYSNNEHELAPGDTLVLYTDGVLEARDRRDRMFGLDRLRGLVADGPQAPEALRDELVAAVHAHQESPIGTDDQTLLVLKIAE
ncbi:MAG TPA: PP2C family protein-serine/threonine phosphatase [Rudaea sp.]|nr:PP2C family protein-serine/threonine phosphatase [Rudaea sp.]